MVTLKINDKEVSVNDGDTILDAAKKLNIFIPTLCYLKEINKVASCRMCLVEIKGLPKLMTSCSTEAKEGMEVYTETDKIKEARKNNLELLLSNHNKDCDNCLKNNQCKFQELLDKYDIKEKYKNTREKLNIDNSTTYLVRDSNKCILCGRCVDVCSKVQDISVIGRNGRGITTQIGCAFEYPMVDSPCIGCGQCTLVCPTGALTEKDDTKEVENAINNKDLHVIACTAPAVRAALGEEFDMPIGTNAKGKMVTSLRKLGFDKVFDVDFAADLTIMEEVNELIERIKENKNLPMFTSCSPGWIKYVEQYHPELIDNLSTCKSPQQMMGAILKTYYAKKENIDPSKIFVVMIMPCIAKKFERARDGANDIDVVLTTRETARMIKRQNIDFNSLEDSEYDLPLGIGASVVFGSSGGVMEAALRTLTETLTNKPLEKIEFNEVRGLDGIKEATYDVNGREINVAIVSGIKNAKKIIKKIKNKEVNYDFVEFMTCPGGCLNGGGQPYIDFDKYDVEEVKKLRMKCLMEEDKNLPIRKAHENPSIKELYKSFLDHPGSELAEKLLHTKYEKREKYKK
ncbi:MAG: NADH-dependent [FeFe] hydrogenase, group A6 [Bacilli bacterium]|nr:NADH-dependent [FeFe] hydrogenase, group A6 [Bacilli bacterium]